MSATQALLLPNHRKLLQASAISDAVIMQRGYRSVTVKAELARLGFSSAQRQVPALLLPVWSHTGICSLHIIRPDNPRFSRGKPIKYEAPAGARLQVDVPPCVNSAVLNNTEPLFITEGIRKADAAASQKLACIGLLGVHGWRKQEDFWRAVPLKERVVYIVFDSDIETNLQVRKAAALLFAYLESFGARPQLVLLPPNGSEKTGLDDFLARGASRQDLLALASPHAPAFSTAQAKTGTFEYEEDESGIVRVIQTDDGPVRRLICNFKARILSETTFSIANEQIRELTIEATFRDRTQHITLTADEFDRMGWPIPRLGAEAIVMPGYGTKDEVRAAIQMLSPEIQSLRGVARLGWLKHGDEWIYIHSGGIIRHEPEVGNDSEVSDWAPSKSSADKDLLAPETKGPISSLQENRLNISARIPRSLERYRLPKPSTGAQLSRDIRASLSLLSLVPQHISVPIYCGIWYAAIGEPDFSLHLYGTTGGFKTEFAALATQHFGQSIDARNLPANWSSTPNFIRAISAFAKNVVLPVDDFVPTGSQNDIDRSFRAAEDIFRSLGNAAGRGRCSRDGMPQDTDTPKCLILSTGEVRPSGHSLTARIMTIEATAGEILDRNDPVKLKLFAETQRRARSGAFARAMSAFLHWLAAKYEWHRTTLNEQAAQYREVFAREARHARTADIAAKLLAGMDRFLEFVRETGTISDELFEGIWQLTHDGLFEAIEAQEQEQADEDPTRRFLDLLRTALSTGRGHLAYLSPYEDDKAGSPSYFGHEERVVYERPSVPPPQSSEQPTDECDNAAAESSGDANFEPRRYYVPRGARVGWKSQFSLYVEPKAALAVVQKLAREMHQPPIPLGHKALGKRLAERGLLLSSSKGRNVAKVGIEGRKEHVFHFSLSALIDIEEYSTDFTDEQWEQEYEERDIARKREDAIKELKLSWRERATRARQEQLLALLDPDNRRNSAG